MKQVSIGSAQQFQPRQIVCLEHEHTCLYAEVIEVVSARQVCWVRPLMLVSPANNQSLPFSSSEDIVLYDLRQGSDLLWPTSLFRPALDTEVISLLGQLQNPDTSSVNNLDAPKQLRSFVNQVWQAYKSAF
ncbi:MAG: hypothetical protein F6J86_26220 [Symploca sp. SIO1B1]|nr:hypothetical protein [Symploca sp. SIO1C2]NER48144.1 hypothetical protein [Symploca sp. SIO1A3]NER97301.1 hypothetical protein [Symploca sp. SIO1B1]